jgi:hypothetical protein
MRGLALLLLVSTAALADELPGNACFGNLVAGDACLTDDGTSGTCAVVENELICVPTVSAAERKALPWIGAGLAFLALCIGVAARKPQVHSAA